MIVRPSSAQVLDQLCGIDDNLNEVLVGYCASCRALPTAVVQEMMMSSSLTSMLAAQD